MKSNPEDDIDALFRLPLAEFTGARNTLAAQLKKGGHRNEADRVKLLAKPSISAWTVNQIYWMHREAFDQLIASGKRFRRGPRLAGKVATMRESLDARREVLSHLSDLATALLRDAGHNPSPDIMRRIVTTLEAMSAHALLPDGPTPGRLTQDVDPPSFESLASLMSAGVSTEQPPALRKSASATPKKATSAVDVRRPREERQAKIAAAKVYLQDAKKSLSDARAAAQSLESAQKEANADAKVAEKYRREAEERLEKATAASQDSARHAQNVAAKAEAAVNAMEDAKRRVEKATKELESLLRESTAR
jgi:hypothetical protein